VGKKVAEVDDMVMNKRQPRMRAGAADLATNQRMRVGAMLNIRRVKARISSGPLPKRRPSSRRGRATDGGVQRMVEADIRMRTVLVLRN
jgi:hypothetical protein